MLNLLRCAATMRKFLFKLTCQMEKSIRALLDRDDLRILDLLQREGALPVAEVAARSGLSTTTCWRRIQQLRLPVLRPLFLGAGLFDLIHYRNEIGSREEEMETQTQPVRRLLPKMETMRFLLALASGGRNSKI